MRRIANWRSAAIEIQISVHILTPRNGRGLSAALIEEAIRYRATHGRDPRGMHLRIVRWRHYVKTTRWRMAPVNDRDLWKSFSAVFASGHVSPAIPPARRGRR